jgi:hypothetical protein
MILWGIPWSPTAKTFLMFWVQGVPAIAHDNRLTCITHKTHNRGFPLRWRGLAL